MGLLGAPAGLILIVVGVWTLRTLEGYPPGVTWALACLGIGLRWGTATLADVQSAGRLVGPVLLVRPPAAAAASALLVLAALIDEARGAGLRDRSLLQRSAAVLALLALVFIVVPPGAGGAGSIALSVLTAAAFTAISLTSRPVAALLPGWTAPAVAVLAVLVIGLGTR